MFFCQSLVIQIINEAKPTIRRLADCEVSNIVLKN